MIVLDTNVISETMRRVPNAAVVEWLDSQPANDLFLCTPVLAEIYYGVARLDESMRKSNLLRSYRQIVAEVFEGRILPFDAPAAEAYGELVGELVGELESDGNPITVIDAMIAAIAQSNAATLATRNTAHFTKTGVTLVNPFGAP
jgi:predicted nucleic acid-binding protein